MAFTQEQTDTDPRKVTKTQAAIKLVPQLSEIELSDLSYEAFHGPLEQSESGHCRGAL